MDNDQNPSTTMVTNGDVDMDGINNDYSMSSVTPPEINVVDFAYQAQVTQDQDQGNQNQNQGMVYHSAPTSPRGTRMDTDMNMGMGRASSAEPPHTSFMRDATMNMEQTQNVLMDMGMGMGVEMITPIPMLIIGDRKPSLFALMNSRPNTPSLILPQQAHLNPLNHIVPHQGTQVQESPTLFDGLPPISNHHPFDNSGERERRMSVFGSMQMSLPNAGGVGRLSLSKGSEGIGLGLGLEHVT